MVSGAGGGVRVSVVIVERRWVGEWVMGVGGRWVCMNECLCWLMIRRKGRGEKSEEDERVEV